MKSFTLFVRRIPPNTTPGDLKNFADGGVSWLWRLRLGTRYKIAGARILAIRDLRTMEIELHGLVAIEPETLLDHIVNRLDKKHLNGRRVLVRRYHVRSPKNDRRRGQADDVAQAPSDRRVTDRRRQDLEFLDGSGIRAASRSFNRRFI